VGGVGEGGDAVGVLVGTNVGALVGVLVGVLVGTNVSALVGVLVGTNVVGKSPLPSR